MESKDWRELFYNSFSAGLPASEDDYERTLRTIDYMKDAGVNPSGIVAAMTACSKKKVILREYLPDELWNDSLIERGKFYYHHILQLRPEQFFNPLTGKEESKAFYLENLIRFTMNDLINYFMRQLGIDYELRDEKKYASQFNHLLKTSYSFIEPLDFVLALIDRAAAKNMVITEPFELKGQGNVGEVFQSLKAHVANERAHGNGKEIQR